jgi:hypothetical protein
MGRYFRGKRLSSRLVLRLVFVFDQTSAGLFNLRWIEQLMEFLIVYDHGFDGQFQGSKRAGSYSLARIAVKYGAESLLDELFVRLSADCLWCDDPRGTCGVRFTDLPQRRPVSLLKTRFERIDGAAR